MNFEINIDLKVVGSHWLWDDMVHSTRNEQILKALIIFNTLV